jgi:2-polyprenyl-3-methyl-5-hydroxy-6-metoxy-1,4-benzoquinol methylase
MQAMSKSEKFWDRAANTYDQEEKKDGFTMLKIIEKTKKYLNNSDVVLDYGCGTGTLDIEIAGDVKEIRAIDISSKMLDIAQRKTVECKIENINYIQATIYDERLKRESFDVITAFTILHLVENMLNVIKRINDLLTPGGLLISATPCMGEKKLTSVLLSLGGKIGLVPNINSFKYPELENLITNSNFKIVDTESLHPSMPLWFIAAKKI